MAKGRERRSTRQGGEWVSQPETEQVGKPISDIAPEEPNMTTREQDTASDYQRRSPHNAGEPARDQGDPSQRSAGPSEEEIRTRAYFRYEERGRIEGLAEDDWYTAERELRSRW